MKILLTLEHFLNLDFGKLIAASILDADVELINKILKLIEENGELSQAFLALANTGNKSKSASTIQEEAIDVLLVALDIALMMTNHQAELITSFLTDGFTIGAEYLSDPSIEGMPPKDAFYLVFTIQKEIVSIHELFESMDAVDRNQPDFQEEIDNILNLVLKSLLLIMGDAIAVILVSGIDDEELNTLFNCKTQKWLSKAEANHMVGG